MGSVVIRDEVDFLAARCDFVDHPEKFQPFLVAVSIVAHTDDGAIQRVHGCKQRRCSVLFVVVSHGSASSLLDRQARLCAVQGLDLAFLLGTKHHGMLRRVEIKSHDSLQLFRQVRIVADFEGGQVWLQAMFVPDAAYALSLNPTASAMVRVLQWVEWAGFSCVVLRMTSSTLAGVIVGPRPGRGASFTNPAKPISKKRFLQRAAF